MVQAISQTKKNNDSYLLVFLLVSVLITFVLFYMDEGYYNLKWMATGFNWVIFLVYTLILFLPQVILSVFVFSKITPRYHVLLSSSVVIAGICFVFLQPLFR